MPSIATLVSRAAARYLGVGPQTVVRQLARALAPEDRSGTSAAGESVANLPVPVPSRVARGIFDLWLAGLAAFALVVFNVDLFLPGGAADPFRVVVGLVLLTEGLLLLVRRWPFRTVVVARLTAASSRHPSRIRRAAWKRLTGAGLTLLGFVWIAAGMLDLLRGAIALL